VPDWPSWSILGVRVRCRAAPAAILRPLEELLGGFEVGEGKDRPAQLEFEIRAGEDGATWRLRSRGGSPARTEPLGSSPGSAAEYLTISAALDRVTDRLLLHSAALAAPAGSVLVVGASASGKTSLALRLWSEGMALLGDDLCPVPYGRTRPEPFPRAIHLDQQYPGELLRRIPPAPPTYPLGYYPFPDLAADAIGSVRTILVLEREGSPAGELVPLGHSESAHCLLRAAIRARGFRFERAMRTVALLAATADRSFLVRATTAEGAARNALRAL
jgi:hypothetical protein